MSSILTEKLVVAISFKALFNLDESHGIYVRDGALTGVEHQLRPSSTQSVFGCTTAPLRNRPVDRRDDECHFRAQLGQSQIYGLFLSGGS